MRGVLTANENERQVYLLRLISPNPGEESPLIPKSYAPPSSFCQVLKELGFRVELLFGMGA
jgi:hypothetical protein